MIASKEACTLHIYIQLRSISYVKSKYLNQYYKKTNKKL